jgi:hypothetical protein
MQSLRAWQVDWKRLSATHSMGIPVRYRCTCVCVCVVGEVDTDAGLAITCQRCAPRLCSQRAHSPPSATSMPAVRGERGSRLAGEPRTMISHGDDCGLLCAACALDMGGYRRDTRPTMDIAWCRDRVLAVLVPAAGCRMPGRGRAELEGRSASQDKRRQGGMCGRMQSF